MKRIRNFSGWCVLAFGHTFSRLSPTNVVVTSFLPRTRGHEDLVIYCKARLTRIKQNKIPIEAIQRLANAVRRKKVMISRVSWWCMLRELVHSFWIEKVTDSEWKSIIKSWETIMNTHLVHGSVSTDNIQSDFSVACGWYRSGAQTDSSIFFDMSCSAYASQTGKHSLHSFFLAMRNLFSSASEWESQPLVDGFIPLYCIWLFLLTVLEYAFTNSKSLPS